jgi:hypothetical protein
MLPGDGMRAKEVSRNRGDIHDCCHLLRSKAVLCPNCQRPSVLVPSVASHSILYN